MYKATIAPGGNPLPVMVTFAPEVPDVGLKTMLADGKVAVEVALAIAG
jgi:hypothetical protein